MNRILEHSRMLARLTCSPVVAALALTIGAGVAPAFGGTKSTSPKDQTSGLNEHDFNGNGVDVDAVDTDPGEGIPMDFRGHSDVPDLPDSGDEGGESGQNIGFLGPNRPMPGPDWIFDGPVNDFGTFEIAPLKGTGSVVSPSSSAVPSPGGLLALGLGAVLTGARRRR